MDIYKCRNCQIRSMCCFLGFFISWLLLLIQHSVDLICYASSGKVTSNHMFHNIKLQYRRRCCIHAVCMRSVAGKKSLSFRFWNHAVGIQTCWQKKINNTQAVVSLKKGLWVGEICHRKMILESTHRKK